MFTFLLKLKSDFYVFVLVQTLLNIIVLRSSRLTPSLLIQNFPTFVSFLNYFTINWFPVFSGPSGTTRTGRIEWTKGTDMQIFELLYFLFAVWWNSCEFIYHMKLHPPGSKMMCGNLYGIFQMFAYFALKSFAFTMQILVTAVSYRQEI